MASSQTSDKQRLPADKNFPMHVNIDKHQNHTSNTSSNSIHTHVPNYESTSLPRKRFYRQRAHCNPFSDHNIAYPISPVDMDWSKYFPAFFLSLNTIEHGALPDFINPVLPQHDAPYVSLNIKSTPKVTIVDVGCGYGGLLVALSPLFPDTLILGMEIRLKLVDYVTQRIDALRVSEHGFNNISVIRTNSMKCMPHFFEKSQLDKMFFLFPDPHFKKKKHKARIITYSLLSEYAFYLRPGGRIYIATDVPELFDWMSSHLNQHPLFKKLTSNDDPLIQIIISKTEEGIKVARNNGQKFAAVYERIFFEVSTKDDSLCL